METLEEFSMKFAICFTLYIPVNPNPGLDVCYFLLPSSCMADYSARTRPHGSFLSKKMFITNIVSLSLFSSNPYRLLRRLARPTPV